MIILPEILLYKIIFFPHNLFSTLSQMMMMAVAQQILCVSLKECSYLKWEEVLLIVCDWGNSLFFSLASFCVCTPEGGRRREKAVLSSTDVSNHHDDDDTFTCGAGVVCVCACVASKKKKKKTHLTVGCILLIS